MQTVYIPGLIRCTQINTERLRISFACAGGGVHFDRKNIYNLMEDVYSFMEDVYSLMENVYSLMENVFTA